MRKYIFIIAILIFCGCKKENCEEADAQMPIIKMSSPTNNQTVASGNTIIIDGSITDNNKIESVHLEIINTSTGAFITHEHYAPDGASYLLNKSFVAQSAASYKIKVEALDRKGNKAQTQINISS